MRWGIHGRAVVGWSGFSLPVRALMHDMVSG